MIAASPLIMPLCVCKPLWYHPVGELRLSEVTGVRGGHTWVCAHTFSFIAYRKKTDNNSGKGRKNTPQRTPGVWWGLYPSCQRHDEKMATLAPLCLLCSLRINVCIEH